MYATGEDVPKYREKTIRLFKMAPQAPPFQAPPFQAPRPKAPPFQSHLCARRGERPLFRLWPTMWLSDRDVPRRNTLEILRTT